MSRLDEECIMAVVRNRSGIDSGEIDYTLMVDRFENLSYADLMAVMGTLEDLVDRTAKRLRDLSCVVEELQ